MELYSFGGAVLIGRETENPWKDTWWAQNNSQVRMRLTVSAHLAIYTEKQTLPNPDKSTSVVTTGNEAESSLVTE